jgi:hypothetical protein
MPKTKEYVDMDSRRLAGACGVGGRRAGKGED